MSVYIMPSTSQRRQFQSNIDSVQFKSDSEQRTNLLLFDDFIDDIYAW